MGCATGADVRVGGSKPRLVAITEAVRWDVHPLRWEPPGKSVLLAVLIMVSAVTAAMGFEHWLYGAFSMVVLTIAMSRYFFPTHYAIDTTGINTVHLGLRRSIPWGDFRRVDEHRDGVFLSPLVRPGRLDSFRGIFLRYHQNREEVIYFVRQHVSGR